MFSQSPYQTYRRYRSLQTNRIQSLPIVILMPHSACNCRCVMCDIWKGNHNLQQLKESDIEQLIQSLRRLETRQVVMSGGEALLNPHFFRFCELLKKENLHITLLSTGLSLKRYAGQVTEWVDDVIVSLDGDEKIHNAIRNIPDAFDKLKQGIETIRRYDPDYRITARSVIHKLNFAHWPGIISAALDLKLNQVSFLPADLTSHAFNRPAAWGPERQSEIGLHEKELPALQATIEYIITTYASLFHNGFIAESMEKIRNIHAYYAAMLGLGPFPDKKCNAPWVSAVVEADGTVLPCFFHHAIGNIKDNNLLSVLNSDNACQFRKGLNVQVNETCKKCVCYLNLPPHRAPV